MKKKKLEIVPQEMSAFMELLSVRIPVMVTSQFGLMVTTHRSEATPVFFL